MKILKIVLLGLGCYILYATIQAVGVDTLRDQIMELNWKLLPLLAVYPFIFAFNTLGWTYSFPSGLPKPVPLRELYRIRIIGEALNCVIPWAASLGGEPVKAELLKRRHGIPLSDSYASILIVHTTFWVSLNLFVIGALLVTFQSLPLTPVLRNSVLAFLISLALGGLLLFAGLHLGVFEKVHHFGERFKWWGDKSTDQKTRFLKLDQEIKDFYFNNKKRFFLSVFYNFLGWFFGVFETYWIANILGIPIGLHEAWLFEALFQVLRIVTFFIPSSIGAQEGGIVLIFMQFGIGKSAGLTFAVIRRLREIFFIGVGLFLWSLLEDKPKLKDVEQNKA